MELNRHERRKLEAVNRRVMKTARRQGAEASVDLSKMRRWFANAVAYGFVDMEYLFSQRVVDRMIPTVQTAVEQTYEEHNRIINAMMTELVTLTTEDQINYQLPDGGELQPLDEKGNPRPTKPVGTYTIAFPIRGGGDAWADDRVSRAHMTVGDANRLTLSALTKDARWLRRQMLAALFTNVSYVYKDKINGNLTILPLADNDDVTYVRVNGESAKADHYLAQAAAIDDANNPFPTIYNTLSAYPGNNGPYVVYVPTNLVASIKALANFDPARDADIIYGADLTVLQATITTDNPVVNSDIVGFGNIYHGKVDGCHIIEWKSLPDNYMIGLARGAADTPLAMREYVPEELRGLFAEFHSPDGNVMESRYIRYAGFGVRNRIAALVYRIGAGAYSIPSGYDARTLG
jgi:hypothetical protein